MKINTYLLILFLICSANLLFAQTSVQNNLILLIDQSGSLRTNDPLDLRKDALKFLIDQSSNLKKVAIYVFGSDVRNYSSDNGEMFLNFPDEKATALSFIRSLKRGEHLTDLQKGLKRIYNDIGETKGLGKLKVIIFTDAQLKSGDIPKGITIQNYLKKLYQTARLFADKNIEIDGIAFTQKADLSYLQTISGITNGYALKASTPEEVNQNILQLISKSPYGPEKVNKEIKINVSSLVSSFKVYAFANKTNVKLPSVTVKNPSGKIDHEVTTSKYKTSIVVKKNKPEVGTWTIIVHGKSYVKVFYDKKIDYNLIVHKPISKDLSLCTKSVIPFDVEISTLKDITLKGFFGEIFLKDAENKIIRKKKLDRNGKHFFGRFKINTNPGIYNLLVKISNGDDFVKKNYSVVVNDCEDLNYNIISNLNIDNPIFVTVRKPKLKKYKIKLSITSPHNLIKSYKLYDDGLNEHGDELAHDGILSAVIGDFSKAGSYAVNLSLSYLKNNIPVVNQYSENVFKIIEIDPAIVSLSIPADSNNWLIQKEIKIINNSPYKINIEDIVPEDKYIQNLSISPAESQVYLQPNKAANILLKIKGTNISAGKREIKSTVYCTILNSHNGKSIADNAKINFSINLTKTVPTYMIVLKILLVFFILIIILLLLGPLLIIPIRIKNVVYENRIGLSSYYNFPQLRIVVADVGTFGIDYLGFGPWFLIKENTDKKIKGFENCNLRKDI